MKKIVKSFHIVLVLMATLLATNSCSDLLNNPMQDKETGEDLTLLLLDLNFFDTKLLIDFQDAETGNLINQDVLNVYIVGDDAYKVVDVEGKKNASYRINGGILELAIDPAITPSETTPLNIVVIAETDEYKWYSLPTEVEINQTGVNDATILMYYEGEDEEEVIQEETNFQLKSAFSTQATAPFNLTFSSKNASNKKDYATAKYQDDYTVYYYWRPDAKRAVDPEVKLAASAYTGPSGNEFGFYGQYTQNDVFTFFPDLEKDKTYSNIKNYRFYAAVQENVTKCTSPFNVKFTKEDNKPGTATFGYKMTFANGAQKIGKFTIVFPFKDQGGNEHYTITRTITPIYVPVDAPRTSFEIFPEGQYEFTTPQTIVYNDGPCGQTFDVKLKTRTGLKAYQVITTISCENGGIGATPTMFGTILEKGSTEKPTNFSFSQGIATLQLKDKTDYTISGTYNGQSATFDFTTDVANIPAVEAQAAQYEELKEVKIKFDPAPSGDEAQIIRISVVFTNADCPF